ncbi:hypothetical protein DPMN_035537 [Dreissena polymorpha]|uniref:Uncharacterized protein n=1 Tax=Dreissena polymorpha TaxID=45954 RepID=A0A9D4MB57_DREPO|nr:hypothetical protein DPMN_035537 [Dreissena polymorpha]
MIADIGWQPIQARRQTAKVTMMYRISNNLIYIPSNPYLCLALTSTRGNSIRYIVPFCRTETLLLLISNKTLEPTARPPFNCSQP